MVFFPFFPTSKKQRGMANGTKTHAQKTLIPKEEERTTNIGSKSAEQRNAALVELVSVIDHHEMKIVTQEEFSNRTREQVMRVSIWHGFSLSRDVFPEEKKHDKLSTIPKRVPTKKGEQRKRNIPYINT